jgi:imidazolonepropionase-like amidohydrolase
MCGRYRLKKSKKANPKTINLPNNVCLAIIPQYIFNPHKPNLMSVSVKFLPILSNYCRQLFIIFCLFLIVEHASAQQRTDSLPTTAIIAKGMIDVRNGKLVEGIVVLVRNGKIFQVGPKLKIPENANLISLTDSYLLPGLVDAHSHLCHEYTYELEKVPGSNIVTESVMLDDASRAMLGVKNARSLIMSGFTTARDLGNSGTNADVALKKAIDKGWTIGPRLYVSTRALAPIGGQFPSMDNELQRAVISKQYVEINGPDDARRAVRQAIFDGANCIKIIVNNNKLVLSSEELTTIVQEAQGAGLRVAAHATQGDGPALLAIKAGVNSIEHGYTLSDTVLKIMASRGIYLVPTDAPGVPRYQQRIQRALAAGVKIAFGSDMYYEHPNSNRGQMTVGMYRSYVDAGMTNLQILQSATMHPGALIAGDGQIGLIEPGYFADIIAVPENPLDNILSLERVSFVMKEGLVVKMPEARRNVK